MDNKNLSTEMQSRMEKLDELTIENIVDKLVLEGRSFFITGEAGTGKSYVMAPIANELVRLGKRFEILAPTGIAAKHVRGRTFHSYLKIDPTSTFKKNKKTIIKNINLFDRKQKIEVMIIDEISMVNVEIIELLNIHLQKVNGSKKPFGGVKMLFFGDFLQLPPVSTEESTVKKLKGKDYAFEMDIWNELNPDVLFLKTNHRVDQVGDSGKFIQLLRDFRFATEENKEYILNKVREFSRVNDDLLSMSYNDLKNKSDENDIALFTSNEKVDEHNLRIVNKIKGDLYSSVTIEHGINNENDVLKIHEANSELKHLHRIQFTIGSKIMFTSSDSTANSKFVNGTRGKITSVTCDENGEPYSVKVKVENEKKVENENEFEVYRKKYKSKESNDKWIEQFPFRLSYAYTIHKSQGQSLSGNVWINIDKNGDETTPGILYTALSRITDHTRLKLIDLDTDMIIQPNKSIEYYKNIMEDNNINKYSLDENTVASYAKGFNKTNNINDSIKEIQEIVESSIRNSSSNKIQVRPESEFKNQIARKNYIESNFTKLDTVEFQSPKGQITKLKKDEIVDIDNNKHPLTWRPSGLREVTNNNYTVFYREDDNTRVPSVSKFLDVIFPFPKEENPIKEFITNQKANQSNSYGNFIDGNKNLAVNEWMVEKGAEKAIILDFLKLKEAGLKIVAINQPIVHKDKTYSGEIDQILYHEATDTYIVSDTKTNASVTDYFNKERIDKKIETQIHWYIQALKSNNPDIKISDVGIVDWIRFNENEVDFKDSSSTKRVLKSIERKSNRDSNYIDEYNDLIEEEPLSVIKDFVNGELINDQSENIIDALPKVKVPRFVNELKTTSPVNKKLMTDPNVVIEQFKGREVTVENLENIDWSAFFDSFINEDQYTKGTIEGVDVERVNSQYSKLTSESTNRVVSSLK